MLCIIRYAFKLSCFLVSRPKSASSYFVYTFTWWTMKYQMQFLLAPKYLRGFGQTPSLPSCFSDKASFSSCASLSSKAFCFFVTLALSVSCFSSSTCSLALSDVSCKTSRVSRWEESQDPDSLDTKDDAISSRVSSASTSEGSQYMGCDQVPVMM